MALTITNSSTLNLLNLLNRTSLAQAVTLMRLGSGSRINRAQDDPAGLIALGGLDDELASVNAAISSNERTDATLSVVDSSLGEVSRLLGEIQGLAVASAGSTTLTADELAANQAQVDNAIDSINRIVGSTSFDGRNVLDGTLGIRTAGVDSTKLAQLNVYSRNPFAGPDTVAINVVTAAKQARTSGTAQALMTTSADVATTLTIQGRLGMEVIDIGANENLSSVVSRINALTAETGVVASQTATNGAVHLHSQGYGSAEFVKVTVLEGGTTHDSNEFRTVNRTGSDADVLVNGRAAAADGKSVYYSSGGLSLAFTLTDTGNAAGATTSFTVDDDSGATFQLGTDASSRATIGISGLFPGELGTGVGGEVLASLKSGGAHDLLSDPGKAAEIAEAAQRSVSTLRGRVGGFQKYQVQSMNNAMASMREGLTTARSSIADADYAAETAAWSRQNVLMQSTIALLGLVNQQGSQILELLR